HGRSGDLSLGRHRGCGVAVVTAEEGPAHVCSRVVLALPDKMSTFRHVAPTYAVTVGGRAERPQHIWGFPQARARICAEGVHEPGGECTGGTLAVHKPVHSDPLPRRASGRVVERRAR